MDGPSGNAEQSQCGPLKLSSAKGKQGTRSSPAHNEKVDPDG